VITPILEIEQELSYW